jgi:flagellar biosynthesis chaperone FliJ
MSAGKKTAHAHLLQRLRVRRELRRVVWEFANGGDIQRLRAVEEYLQQLDKEIASICESFMGGQGGGAE